MLIYKGNFCFVQVISCFWGELTAISATAPQTAEIPIAKQQPTKVQLHRPDFDNGMKTDAYPQLPRHDWTRSHALRHCH